MNCAGELNCYTHLGKHWYHISKTGKFSCSVTEHSKYMKQFVSSNPFNKFGLKNPRTTNSSGESQGWFSELIMTVKCVILMPMFCLVVKVAESKG